MSSGKKTDNSMQRNADGAATHSGYSLAAFHQQLCGLCAHHFDGSQGDRACGSQNQAQQTVSLARQLGLLNSPQLSWAEFKVKAKDLHFGAEHVVDLSLREKRVVKMTIPPAFGLIPQARSHRSIHLRDDPLTQAFRQEVEFLPATPIEYLARWLAANELFQDEVALSSVVLWADGQLSFVVSQPQYHGEPATDRAIEEYFKSAGWTRLADVSSHKLYYNYAFGILAIDAMPRNCYLSAEDGSLLPFDVILSRPDLELARLLHLYPE